MEYNLELVDDIDMTISTQGKYNVQFNTRGDAPPISTMLELIPVFTRLHLKKFIGAEIKFYHKKQVDVDTISIFYMEKQLGEGKVLTTMAHIEALPTS